MDAETEKAGPPAAETAGETPADTAEVPIEETPVASVPPVDKEAIRERVRELATVSGDVDLVTRQLARPLSTMQVGLLNDRLEQLTRRQQTLVAELAAECADAAMRTRFAELDGRLVTLRKTVQETRDAAELERCRAEIDPLVDEWAQLFQDIVIYILQH